jgi:DNA-binding response OmpR family regulator
MGTPGAVKVRVLVIEDEPRLGQALRTGLAKAGCEVTLATSVEAAVPLMDQVLPHVFIVDSNLPGLNGLNLAAHVRRSEKHKAAKIIAMSGDPAQKQVADILRSQYDVFLTKPFAMKDLIDVIRKLLSK